MAYLSNVGNELVSQTLWKCKDEAFHGKRVLALMWPSSLLLSRGYSLFAVCAASFGVATSIVWLSSRFVPVTCDPVPVGSSHPCHAIAVAMLALSQLIVPHPWLWRPSLGHASPLVVALSPRFSRLALPSPLRSSLPMFSTLGNSAPPLLALVVWSFGAPPPVHL